MGNSFANQTCPRASGIHQEKNVYWKLVRPLRIQNALHSAHGNLVHATSLLWDFITQNDTNRKWASCIFYKIQTRKKMPESHIKMIEPLIESNSCGKVRKSSYMEIYPTNHTIMPFRASPFWFYRNVGVKIATVSEVRI